MPPNSAISIYPPLFARESRPIERTSRRAVPLHEQVAFNLHAASRFGGA